MLLVVRSSNLLADPNGEKTNSGFEKNGCVDGLNFCYQVLQKLNDALMVRAGKRNGYTPAGHESMRLFEYNELNITGQFQLNTCSFVEACIWSI